MLGQAASNVQQNASMSLGALSGGDILAAIPRVLSGQAVHEDFDEQNTEHGRIVAEENGAPANE